jgi:hypothetical protein
MYTSTFLQGSTRSPFVDLFLAVAPNSICNGKSARVLDDFVWVLERQIDCANRAWIPHGVAVMYSVRVVHSENAQTTTDPRDHHSCCEIPIRPTTGSVRLPSVDFLVWFCLL